MRAVIRDIKAVDPGLPYRFASLIVISIGLEVVHDVKILVPGNVRQAHTPDTTTASAYIKQSIAGVDIDAQTIQIPQAVIDFQPGGALVL